MEKEITIYPKTMLLCNCKLCKKEYKLMVNTVDLENYNTGNILIQNAFPYLNDGERELIISGICDTCFNDIMKDDEEFDEDMPENYEYNNRD